MAADLQEAVDLEKSIMENEGQLMLARERLRQRGDWRSFSPNDEAALALT